MMKAMFSLFKSLKVDRYSLLIVMNLLLAVCAFLKDVVFAHFFGTSGTADAYTLGFFIPDMIGNNILAAALGVTCIPIFSRLLVRGYGRLLTPVVRRVFVVVFLICLVICGALYLDTQQILKWFGGHHLSVQTRVETVQAYHAMIPIVMFVPLTFIGVALLQTKKRFVMAALAPVVYQVILIASLITMGMVGIQVAHAGRLYSVLTSLSSLIYLVIVWMAVLTQKQKQIHEAHVFSAKRSKPYLSALIKGLLPYFFILIVTQALLSVERYLASGLDSGTLAALNYATRLVQFPLFVFVAAITTVLLPDISHDLSAKRSTDVMRQVNRTLLFTFALGMCMSFGLFIFKGLIVTLLFKRGAFDEHSVMQTVAILKGFSFTIIGQGFSLVALRLFLATRKMAYPLMVYLIATSISILLDFLGVPRFGAATLGYSETIGATLSGLLFLWGIYRMNRFYKIQTKS